MYRISTDAILVHIIQVSVLDSVVPDFLKHLLQTKYLVQTATGQISVPNLFLILVQKISVVNFSMYGWNWNRNFNLRGKMIFFTFAIPMDRFVIVSMNFILGGWKIALSRIKKVVVIPLIFNHLNWQPSSLF